MKHLRINLVVKHPDINELQRIVRVNSNADFVLTINAEGRAERRAHSFTDWSAKLNDGTISVYIVARRLRKAQMWHAIEPLVDAGLGRITGEDCSSRVSERATQVGVRPDVLGTWLAAYWRKRQQ